MFDTIKRFFKKRKDEEEIEALRTLVDNYRTYIDSLKQLQELSKKNTDLKIDLLLKKLEEYDTQRTYPGVM